MIRLFPVPYDELARFASTLATALAAGLGLRTSLRLGLRPLARTRLAPLLADAEEQATEGVELSQILRPADRHLPPFFLPVIQAGEQTGRLDEALTFLDQRCRMLAGPARAVRNVWFFPLCILVFGSAIKLLLLVALGSIGQALIFLGLTVWEYAKLAAILLVVLAPPLRPLVDRIRLSLPWLGTVERELAIHSFFQTLALLYAVAGRRVERMIEVAARTVDNRAARDELLKAAVRIVRGSTISEAFQAPAILDDEQRDLIAAGELAGTLESSFERIANLAGQSLEFKLRLIQQFAVRLLVFAATMSLAYTVLSLAAPLGGG